MHVSPRRKRLAGMTINLHVDQRGNRHVPVEDYSPVPELTVDNQTNTLVLFLEGEELRGAKQNRVLNTSVLVAAKSKVKIPVSCVESGRWHYRSRFFASGGYSSSKLRHILKESVSKSTKEGRGHTSDQGKVWKEVSRQMDSLGTVSPTDAMSDTFDSYKERLAEYQNRLKYVEGATGLAVAVGNKVVSVDLFDKPSTCQKVWDRLLSGLIMDALEAGPEKEQVEKADAEKVLALLRQSSWEQTKAIGTGEEYRAAVHEGDLELVDGFGLVDCSQKWLSLLVASFLPTALPRRHYCPAFFFRSFSVRL